MADFGVGIAEKGGNNMFTEEGFASAAKRPGSPSSVITPITTILRGAQGIWELSLEPHSQVSVLATRLKLKEQMR